MSKNSLFFQILAPYQQAIESRLLQIIPDLSKKNSLRDACEYILINSGKRFRPCLVLLITKALKSCLDVSKVALAVEFFHTASLVADDLPCMDNDDLRRNKPSLHKKYGESTALLVSYALIAAGYEFLASNARTLQLSKLPYSVHSDRICVLALENATYNTGLLGATGGQFLDINPPRPLDINSFKEIIRLKTVSLFEISFVLGWLYGGGNLSQLDIVKKIAYHFGMAFQMADDFEDFKQDVQNSKIVNIVAVCGLEQAFILLQAELDNFEETLKQLQLEIPELKKIAFLLKEQAKQHYQALK